MDPARRTSKSDRPEAGGVGDASVSSDSHRSGDRGRHLDPGHYAQAQRARGGRGGPGGPVGPVGQRGSILSLAQYPVVQKELKLTDAQKTKIRSVAELSNQRQQKLRDLMNPRGQSGQGTGPGGNGGGGPGGQGNAHAEMAARFAEMGEARMVLDEDIENALASILERGQYGRLKQVQLQVEGISAIMRPDMIEKLNLDEFQVEQIRELLDQSRQAQRESGQVMMGHDPDGPPQSDQEWSEPWRAGLARSGRPGGHVKRRPRERSRAPPSGPGRLRPGRGAYRQ